MKKTLLMGITLSMFAFQAQAGLVQKCACAGRCSTGTVCNCATNTCAARPASPYAYGYVDTRTPVYTQNYTVNTYQPATGYMAPYAYTGEPAKKYSSRSVQPYIAGRFLLSKALADFEHKQTQDGSASASYKGDIDDTTYGGALAFGVKVDNFRAEVEGALHSEAESKYPYAPMTVGQTQDAMKQKVEAFSILFNAYYDFKTKTALTPYIGAGLGFGRLKTKLSSDETPDTGFTDIYSVSKNKTNFIWQIGAGFSYAIDKGIDLDLGYRYTHYGKIPVSDWSGEIDAGKMGTDTIKVKDYRTHTLSLGLRFDI